MPRRKSVSKEMVDDVAKRTFDVLPMLKRRLLRMDAVQAEHSVPMSQVQVLTMLGETGMMTVSEISSRLGIAKPNITPLVDKLIADGYVERKRDEIDRRVVKVLLLPAGAEKLESIRETIGRHAMRWVSVVPDKDFYDLQYALETIVRVLNAVD